MQDRLRLADHCHVVLDVAGGDAGPAAGALVVVDRHAPAIGLVGIGVVAALELEGRALEVVTATVAVIATVFAGTAYPAP